MTDSKSGLVFVRIPAGEFQMGRTFVFDGIRENRQPGHRESVKGFWMEKTAVTVAAYGKCLEAGHCTAPGGVPTLPHEYVHCNGADRADHPVNCVDWNQANAFCGWIAGRLPTILEREYAATSGQDRIYPWGDAWPTAELALFSSRDGTSPVGCHPAGNTPWGLEDMAGNVWEWTATDLPDPTGMKELRGGSWESLPRALRAANDDSRSPPTKRNARVGFRCIRPDR